MEGVDHVTVLLSNFDKTGCSNYTGISLLSLTYKRFPNIQVSKLPPYAEELIGDN